MRRHLLPTLRAARARRASAAPRRRTGDRRPAPGGSPAPSGRSPRGELARANSTNASAARVGVRPAAARARSRVRASSPSTFAAASVPAASSGSTAEREMNVTPYPACTALRTDSCRPSSSRTSRSRSRAPERSQLVLDDLAHAGTFLHQDQALAAQLVERSRCARRRRGRAGKRGYLVVEERLEGDRAVAAGRADDPELELARGDPLDDGVRVGDGERRPDARDARAGTRRAGAARRSRPGRSRRRSAARPQSSPSPSPAISSRSCPSSVSSRWAPR